MTARRPLFLAPAPYRRRRLRDAARLLPLAGAFLFLLPILWAPRAGGGSATGTDGLYLFGVWGVLIAAAAWIAGRLRGAEPATGDEED